MTISRITAQRRAKRAVQPTKSVSAHAFDLRELNLQNS
jgi:hypothetical protein